MSTKHDIYIRLSADGTRNSTAVSRGVDEFSGDLLKNMIAQTGMKKDEFYGQTKESAKKRMCPFLHANKLEPEATT